MAKIWQKMKKCLVWIACDKFFGLKKGFLVLVQSLYTSLCMHLPQDCSVSQWAKNTFSLSKNNIDIFIDFFWKYARKKIHLLSAFLEWFSIFNYSPLLLISELILDKKFHQNAALCIHLWKRIKSHEMKIRKSNRALTGKNFSSSLNPEILRKG